MVIRLNPLKKEEEKKPENEFRIAEIDSVVEPFEKNLENEKSEGIEIKENLIENNDTLFQEEILSIEPTNMFSDEIIETIETATENIKEDVKEEAKPQKVKLNFLTDKIEKKEYYISAEIKEEVLDENQKKIVKRVLKKYPLDQIPKLFDEILLLNNKLIEIKKALEKEVSSEELQQPLEILKQKDKRYMYLKASVANLMETYGVMNAITVTDGAHHYIKTLIIDFILEDFFDFGVIYKVLKNDKVTNLNIRNGYLTYTEVGSNDTKVYNTEPLSKSEVKKMLEKILRDSKMLTTSTPIVNTVLPKLGYRVNAVLESLTSSYTPVISIRKKYSNITFELYRQSQYFVAGCEEFFTEVIRKKLNIIITGGTGSGKTAFLNAVLTGLISKKESLITIEDTAELFVEGVPNWVAFIADNDRKERNVSELFKAALRQQPDRIPVGEIRDGVMAYYMLQAMNSGHSGNLATMHADSAELGIRRLISMLGEGKSGSEKNYADMIRSAIHYICQVGKVVDYDGVVRFKMLEIYKLSTIDPFLKSKDRMDKLDARTDDIITELNSIKNENATISNKIKVLLENLETTTPDVYAMYKLTGLNALTTSYNTNVQCLNTELSAIKIQTDLTRTTIDYSPVEGEYILKYDRYEKKYVINDIEKYINNKTLI